MKIIVIPILLFFCVIQITYSQAEDGVVALDVPVRNSMMFNRFEVNPTFSFVREQNKHITVTNKREHMEIEDAPQTYLFNYSGRFRENIGAGIGLFQQNYGVLTTFGGIVNFAYNIRLQEDSNLTFGINIGASIGFALYLSQAISVAFYVIAFAEAFDPLIAWLVSM